MINTDEKKIKHRTASLIPIFQTVIVPRGTGVRKGHACYLETNILPQAANNFEVINAKDNAHMSR
jgi:hypothetical protein